MHMVSIVTLAATATVAASSRQMNKMPGAQITNKKIAHAHDIKIKSVID